MLDGVDAILPGLWPELLNDATGCDQNDYDNEDHDHLEPRLAVDTFVDWRAEVIMIDVVAGKGMVARVAGYEVVSVRHGGDLNM